MLKSLITSLLLSFSLLITAQTIEVKGSIIFKTIQQKDGVKDTIVSKGARALITLFNKKDSKMVSIAEDNGDYFFDLDTVATPFTHIEFLNMEGGYATFAIHDIKFPFFDVVIINEENEETIKSRSKNKQKQTTVTPQAIIQPNTQVTPPTETIIEPAAIEPPKTINEPKLDLNKLLPEEPEEETMDPETEKLNREIKELEEALKKAEAEKQEQTK